MPKAVIIASSPEEATQKFLEWKGACAKPTPVPGSIWIKRILEFPICPMLQINEDKQELVCGDSLKDECTSLCWLGGIVDAFDSCPIHALHEACEGIERRVTVGDTTYMVESWLD